MAMTVKLLLADDELIIRDGIRNKMDWSGMGIELVGAAENGKVALDMLKNGPVDILLTDIHMPYMDGIQLCREARKLHPNIKIVVLSGYEEFEFAQQALEFSAMKYMLKPFTSRELEQIVLQAKQEVTGHRRAESTLQLTMKRLQESFPLLREKVLTRLVEGRMNEREARQKLESLEIALTGERFAVWVVEPEADTIPSADAQNGVDAGELLLLMLRDEIEAFMRNRRRALVFSGLNANIVCIVEGDDGEQTHLFDLPESLKSHVFASLDMPVSIGLGGVKHGLEGIAGSYREALEALEYRFLIGDNSVIPVDYINFEDEPDRVTISEKHIEKLTTAVRLGNKAGIRGELDAVFAAIRGSAGLPISDIKLYMKEFLAVALRQLLQSGVRLKEIYGKEFDPYSAVDHYRTMDDMQRGLRTMFAEISDFVRDKRGNKTRSVIQRAVEYIDVHYRIEDLSINRLSEELQMNTSYFSRLFKQEMGCTFTEYLTRTRIEKAKHLLRGTTMRVSEITFEVGMKDPFYFSTLFKKVTGVNPTEYREQ
ncbi:response regulator [Paenibacillus hemerocallicola]|jgi:two-component system response regulator YesN|uniref:Response regulator n=2 Tax=Paenibacillus hemerocallicola TaxID=1172614 RepID=A0A5C4TBG4_9BACL|nr:response regulator [Paenibacillus hemerocallicola]